MRTGPPIIFPEEPETQALSSEERNSLFQALEKNESQFSIRLRGEKCLAVTQEASLTGWTVE